MPRRLLFTAEAYIGRWLFPLDLALAAASTLCAAALTRAGDIGWLWPMLLALAIQPVVSARLDLYRSVWRHAGPLEFGQVPIAIALGTVVMVVVDQTVAPVLGRGSAPPTFWLLVGVLDLGLMGGARYAIRVLGDLNRLPLAGPVTNTAATLLFGAGEVGALVARSARNDPRAGIRPVGFLDDDRTLRGRTVAHLKVLGGLSDLREAVATTGARRLVITMPNADGAMVRKIVEAGGRAGLEVRTVPALSELLDGTIDAYRIRSVRLDDLLKRPINAERAGQIEAAISGRRVLITGAGGSIGSELARQVWAMEPAALTLIDRSEGALYAIQRELEHLGKRGIGNGELHIQLANVASRKVMQRIFTQRAPQTVFHAAAYKHVPMMEQHPSDAVHVNIGGTLSVVEAAIATEVERLVFVSTDKAVAPSSVMGATKRIGEALVVDAARKTGQPWVSVRFGNVLGSSGSVLPIFKEQLELGQALTITDPEMTRYFMTIPEAVWLILDAATIGKPGDLFVLDMGEPVRILDLARDLVRLAGKDPESVPIEFIGPRPGEKLREELFYTAEEVRPTASPKVLLAQPLNPPAGLRDDVSALMRLAGGERDERLRSALFALVTRIGSEAPVRDAGLPLAPSVTAPRLLPVQIAAPVTLPAPDAELQA